MAAAVHLALFISRLMAPMAAKQGAHSRLKAQKAMMAALLPPSMAAKDAHRLGSVSPTSSPRLVMTPTVATTFSLATSPVMEVTADSQLPKPSGAKIQASRLPRPAMRLYWM